MAIEKDVAIKLKVVRPQDGRAMADISRQAERLNKELQILESRGGKAMANLGEHSKRVAAEVAKANAGVTALMRDIGRDNRAALAIENLTRRLQALGVAAQPAATAAARLIRQIGDQARVTEADVRRLAGTLRAVPGGASPTGFFGRAQAALGQRIGGGSLGRLALAGLGASIIHSGGQAVSTAFETPLDDQINQLARRNNPFAMAAGDVARGIPIIGSVAGGIADLATAGPRAAAQTSQMRLTRQQVEAERRREQLLIRTQGAISERAVDRESERTMNMARIDAAVAPRTAFEQRRDFQAGLRMEGMQRQFQQEMEAAGRGEGVGRVGTGALRSLRGEIANRPDFGMAERQRIAGERMLAERELASAQAAQARTQQGAAGGVPATDLGMEAADAARRIAEAQQRLVELRQRDVVLTRQAAEAERGRLENLRQFAATAEQNYQRMAQHERQRIADFRVQFGLMDEMEQLNLQQIAAQAAANGGRGIQNLSPEQLRQLQASGLADEQVRGEATRRGNLAGAGNIVQALGAEDRVRAAEARQAEAAAIRVQVEQQITNNINLQGADIARSITEQLLPQLTQAMQAAVAQVRLQTEQALEEAERRRRLQAAGPQ